MHVNIHPVTPVRVGPVAADIDTMIAPLIEAIWRAGIATLTSCQDAGESNADWAERLPHMADYVNRHRGWAFVDFRLDQGLAFLDAVAAAGERDDFYVRMTHWAAPDAWRLQARPYDAAMFDERRASTFDITMLQVMLPHRDLGETTRRLTDFTAGRLVEPAPTDWSTVGR
jgi:hypothetical protein